MVIAAFVVVYCLLLALNIWFFLVRPDGPWHKKLGVVLQVVGLYTFALGVVTQTSILPRTMADEMTSPDLFVFLRGNMTALAAWFLTLSAGLDPAKTSFSAFAFVELFLMLGLSVVTVVYTAVHLLVLVPLSYVAYVLVSVPISSITTSGSDFSLTVGSETISIKSIVATHMVPIRNLSIAFPALALKAGLEILGISRGPRPSEPGSGRAASSWWGRHPRFSRGALLACQIGLGFTAAFNVVAAPLLPAMATGENIPVGEIVGAEIVVGLMIVVSGVLFVRAKHTRLTLRSVAVA